MEIGLALPSQSGWEVAAALARRAEWLGLSPLWVFDHGEPLTGLDPLTTLAGLSRATAGVGLGVTLLAPLRPPAVVAKALATSDLLSGGRIRVAMSTGRQPSQAAAEAAAAELLGEAVQVMRGAFGGGPFTYHGHHLRVDALRCRPRPHQRPGPPIWIAGSEPRLMATAARHGDGWMPDGSSGTLEDYRSARAALDHACVEAARDPVSVPSCVRRAVLVGRSEDDLRRRWEGAGPTLSEWSDGSPTLDDYRRGRLVGTVEQVGEQVAAWREAGVATLLLDLVTLAFTETTYDDVDLVASAVLSGR